MANVVDDLFLQELATLVQEAADDSACNAGDVMKIHWLWVLPRIDTNYHNS
jgi:hypothetical protein